MTQQQPTQMPSSRSTLKAPRYYFKLVCLFSSLPPRWFCLMAGKSGTPVNAIWATPNMNQLTSLAVSECWRHLYADQRQLARPSRTPPNRRAESSITAAAPASHVDSGRRTLPQLQGIFIFDSQGHWLITSSDNVPKNANNADREYFQYHQNYDANTPYISKVIRSRSTGDLIIPISRRFNNPGGSFAGVIMAALYLDYFHQFYDNFALNTDASLNLLMADGTILYRRPTLWPQLAKYFSEHIVCSAKFYRTQNLGTPPSPRRMTRWNEFTATHG